MAKEKTTPQQEYFEANKEVKAVFGTSDGYLFSEKQFAIGHANTLEEGKNNVETFNNPFLVEVEESEEVKE